MHKPMLAALAALTLTACGGSKTLTAPLKLPPPPKAAQTPCVIPPLSDGPLTAAGVEQAIRDRAIAIAECEAKRRLLVEAWPKT